jgi:hypothetical protein
MMTIIITLLASNLRIHTKWVIFNSFLSLFSATSGGILDRAIEAEDQKHGDFLRLVILSYLVLPLLLPLSATCIITSKVVLLYSFRRKKMRLNFMSVTCEQNHVEGYLELSAKTKEYFTTAVALWDADFYIKVDDDVHVNIGELIFLFSTMITLLALHTP